MKILKTTFLLMNSRILNQSRGLILMLISSWLALVFVFSQGCKQRNLREETLNAIKHAMVRAEAQSTNEWLSPDELLRNLQEKDRQIVNEALKAGTAKFVTNEFRDISLSRPPRLFEFRDGNRVFVLFGDQSISVFAETNREVPQP